MTDPANSDPEPPAAAAGPDVLAGDAATTRIGVAIDIPPPWGRQLTERRLAAGDPAAAHVPAHITLLGPTEVQAADLPAIEDHLAAVAAARPPYQVELRGTGTFRPLTQVVFVAVAAGIAECELLADAIGASGLLERELRFPYHPHVTVAHDVPPEALDAVYADLAGFSAAFTADRFTLFSHTGDGHWLPRRDFPLHGRAAAE